jgi:hypothetical protein
MGVIMTTIWFLGGAQSAELFRALKRLICRVSFSCDFHFSFSISQDKGIVGASSGKLNSRHRERSSKPIDAGAIR